MQAEYDSEADALSIDLAEVERWDDGVEVHSRGVVTLSDGAPVNVEVLYPSRGLEEPLAAAADRYGLDREALIAAARAAVAAPDRPVTLDVGTRAVV